MRKSQADIISVVLIIIIAMGLLSAAYFWGLPLIQKSQDSAKVQRVSKYFDKTTTSSLPQLIEKVANNGGEVVFSSDVDGLWTLTPYDKSDTDGSNSNYIEFTFVSKSTNAALDIWVPDLCKKENKVGLLGSDTPSVICEKVEKFGADYRIKYRLWFKELSEDPSNPDSKSYRIVLAKHPSGIMSSTGKSIRISQGSIGADPSRQNLIMTEIKILLGY